MEVYLVWEDNGGEWEGYEKDVIAVCEDEKTALNYLQKNNFQEQEETSYFIKITPYGTAHYAWIECFPIEEN